MSHLATSMFTDEVHRPLRRNGRESKLVSKWLGEYARSKVEKYHDGGTTRRLKVSNYYFARFVISIPNDRTSAFLSFLLFFFLFRITFLYWTMSEVYVGRSIWRTGTDLPEAGWISTGWNASARRCFCWRRRVIGLFPEAGVRAARGAVLYRRTVLQWFGRIACTSYRITIGLAVAARRISAAVAVVAAASRGTVVRWIPEQRWA